MPIQCKKNFQLLKGLESVRVDLAKKAVLESQTEIDTETNLCCLAETNYSVLVHKVRMPFIHSIVDRDKV